MECLTRGQVSVPAGFWQACDELISRLRAAGKLMGNRKLKVTETLTVLPNGNLRWEAAVSGLGALGRGQAMPSAELTPDQWHRLDLN